MPDNATLELRELEQEPEIKEALEQTTNHDAATPPIEPSRNYFWIFAYLIAGAILASGWLLIQWNRERIELSSSNIDLILRAIVGMGISTGILLLQKIADQFLVRRIKTKATQFNLHRVLVLLATLMIAVVILSVLFLNKWTTAFVSLGLV